MVPSRLRPVGLLALLSMSFLTGVGRAQEAKSEIAARLLPADTAFYSSSLRLGKQFDLVAKSRAWKGIVEKFSLDAPGGPFEKLADLRNNFDVGDLLDAIGDGFSHEIFYDGTESIADLTDLLSRVQNTSRFDQFFEQAKGKRPDPQVMPRQLLRSLLANRNLIKTPELILGFKIVDQKRAAKQLDRLKDLIEAANLNAFIKTTKIRGAEFISAELSGEMVPWGLIPFDNYAEKDGEFDPLVKKLKSVTLNINLGISQGYLLASIGPSNAYLEKFGGAGKRLLDMAEFQPLKKYAAKPLASVGYASKSFRARTPGGIDVDDLFGKVSDLVPANVVSPKVREKLRGSLKSMGKDAQAAAALIGGEMGFSYFTDRGFESFHYDWTQYAEVDDSKPLSLANNVGGSPILAFVSRTPSNPGDYDQMVTGFKDIAALVDETSSVWPADRKKEYDRILKAAQPILVRLDAITGKLLVPALAEGQSALVIDAKWSSARWQKDMPVFYKPLPMPELAIVFGVSDPVLLEKAIKGYGSLIEDSFTTARGLYPKEKIPDFKFPAPVVKKTAAGKVWTWPLPKELAVDVRVAPTLGVSDKVGVAAASEDHVQRLLKGTPLTGESKLLEGIDRRKLASIGVFDWARLIDAVDPWAEFVTKEALKSQGREDESAQVLEQVRAVLGALKCFRSVTTISYREGAPIVTQSESIFRDLPGR